MSEHNSAEVRDVFYKLRMLPPKAKTLEDEHIAHSVYRAQVYRFGDTRSDFWRSLRI
jgi:hypothetical protein